MVWDIEEIDKNAKKNIDIFFYQKISIANLYTDY